MTYELSKEEIKTLTKVKAVPYLFETLKQIDNFVANNGQTLRVIPKSNCFNTITLLCFLERMIFPILNRKRHSCSDLLEKIKNDLLVI